MRKSDRQSVRAVLTDDVLRFWLDAGLSGQYEGSASSGRAMACAQASQKGNFTARLAHSCVPSCKAVTMIAGGRLLIGIYTTRAVAKVLCHVACSAQLRRVVATDDSPE